MVVEWLDLAMPVTMSSTNLVRSALECGRRSSRAGDIRRSGSFSINQPGLIICLKKKSASDEEDEDDEIETQDIQVCKKSRVLSKEKHTVEDDVISIDKRSKNKDASIITSLHNADQEENIVEDDTDGSYSFLHLLKGQYVTDVTIDPDGIFYYYWKATLSFIVMYNYVVIILRIAFEEMRDEVMFNFLDILSDLFYLCDFFIESRVKYLSNGSYIYDPVKTFKNYLGKSVVKYDIIAIIPFQLLFISTKGICNIFRFPLAIGEDRNLFFVYYALRLNRLTKSHVMNSFFNKTESRTNNPNFLRAVRLSIQLALVIHWIACLYFMVSKYEGLGSSDWAYPSLPEYNSFKRKYIICIYWSIMTLTTIGERPSPVSDMEYIFTGVTFMIGVFVFAAVVGNVGEVISNMNAARRDFQTRMDQIKFYLNHRQVPEALQTRIKRWAEYTWDRTKAVDEPSVFQWLPERLRTEVAIHVHLSTLRKVTIFDECEEGLLRELVLKLKPQIFSPGDYICRIGEIGREMFIINHGQVEILFPDADSGAMRQVALMNPGNFFGEISLLKLDDGQNKRTADVRSVGFSELLCLSRRDLMVALTEYPEAKRILEEYAKKRFHQTRNQSSSKDNSANSSRRESLASNNSPTTARQVFARVMKKEGFASLLRNREPGVGTVKTAVEEMKAEKSSEINQQFIALHKEIQDMKRALFQKDSRLKQARDEILHLKTRMTSNGQNPDQRKTFSFDNIQHDAMNSQHNSTLISMDEDLSNCNSDRIISPDSNCFKQCYTNHIFQNQDTSPHHDVNTNSLNQYYHISFSDISPEVPNSELSLDRDIEIDSFNSSADDDSFDDLESIEKRFDEIGKDGGYSFFKPSCSLNNLGYIDGQAHSSAEDVSKSQVRD